MRSDNSLTYKIYENHDDPYSEGKEVILRGRYLYAKFISIFPTIFNTSTFSEYWFPYVLAILALLEFFNFDIASNLIASVGGVSMKAVDAASVAINNHQSLEMGNIQKATVLIDECKFRLFGVCFKTAKESQASSVFGFSEFVTAIALLVIIYTFTDVRYKFRLAIAPLPLFTLTYISIIVIGIGTLFIDVWIASLWPVPELPFNHYILQGILGSVFLGLILLWVHFAFLRPSIFNRRNSERYAREILNIILRGSESELAVIAHELGRSAKSIVEISRRSPSRGANEDVTDEASRDIPSSCAYEILLMMGNRRLCRYIIAASPVTAMEFFNYFSSNQEKSLPIGQFVRNLSTEAILNKDSILYHEDEGYNSGWLGYVRPFSKAIYGDYRLIEVLSRDHSSPLHLHYRIAWGLDPQQFEVYTRVTLITLESYILLHKRGSSHSYALNQAFEFIGHAAGQIYKVDGKSDFSSDASYSNLNTAVHFVKDAVRILNKNSIPSDRLKARDGYGDRDIYDQIANLIFEIILGASGVKSPRDTCWTIHYNSVWSDLFTFPDKGKAQKIIYHRVRRLLYNEIKELSDLPNYKAARILGICLNVLGPVIHKNTFKEHHIALHKALISWLKKNYLSLRERQIDVANACLMGSITYEDDKKRLAKSYIKGLGLKEPKEYLELEPIKKNGGEDGAEN